MFPQQEGKLVTLVAPYTVTNGGTGAGRMVDMLGYKYAEVFFINGTSGTQSGVTNITLYEADVTSTSSASAIAAFTLTTDTTSVHTLLGANQTTTGFSNFFKFNVDLRKRKRYLQLRWNPTTTVHGAAFARLSKGETEPWAITTPTTSVAGDCGAAITG